MQLFDELPRSVQLRRMRRLAQTALAAYALREAELTPIQHFLNTTFRIDVPAIRERYALRISNASFQDAIAIQSELQWLQAIRRDTGLLVPEPVPARDGSLLAQKPHCASHSSLNGSSNP
jgi:Ser/Thr protein kinase RdoA (MazF antagonist)